LVRLALGAAFTDFPHAVFRKASGHFLAHKLLVGRP
jgi:hypothetical protein